MHALAALALATLPCLRPACGATAQEAGAAEAPRPGDPAPSLALTDLDGRAHDLAQLRGRIVVLEWTNHACPAVAAVHGSRVAADVRAAVAGDDVAWLQVDSSWYAPGSRREIAAFRRRAGLEVPYLLDPEGEAARRFGARATPHVFVVDAAGRLAYSGAFDDGGRDLERRSYVLAAVDDLRTGRAVRTPRTRPRGCSIKFGAPRAFEREEIAEDVPALRAYEDAAREARAGRFGEALAALDAALELDLPEPWRVLADPDFTALMLDDESRREVRRRLRERPARGALTLVSPAEPGEPLVLTGTVRDARGAPVPGAVLSLYHTDDAGWYAPGTTAAPNPRLCGLVQTDARGAYRVRTVMPGHYADASDGPAHVHLDVMNARALGFAPHGGHLASLYFEDDPNLRGSSLREITSDGCAIRPPARTAEGVRLYVHDIELQPAD